MKDWLAREYTYRDNSDSAAKNRLGRTWADQDGRQYKYFVVFETNRLNDTFTISEAKELVAQL